MQLAHPVLPYSPPDVSARSSSFILNHTAEPRQYTVHPWLHSNCNHHSDANQLRPVAVPDVLPADLVPGPGLLSMCAGDFVVRGWGCAVGQWVGSGAHTVHAAACDTGPQKPPTCWQWTVDGTV